MDEQTKAALDQILGAVSKLNSTVEQGLADVNRRLGELATAQAVMVGRLDEQRATLNALIPSRLAAVPPAAAE